MIGDQAWIEKALAALVSTSSLSGHEAAVQEVVRGLMLEAGADSVRVVRVDAPRLKERYQFTTPTPTDDMFALVGTWGEPTASPFLVLNGHVDTVPAADGWAIDPLEPRITDGWMNGLGSADMKAGLIGAIAGVARAKAAGTLKGYIEIQSVPDEENGGGTGTLACVDELLTTGRIPDFAIVCEPTKVEIATAQIGSRAMYYMVRGAGAHANTKHKGASAVEAAIALARDLGAWADMPQRSKHPLLPPSTVNVGRIDGGLGATSVAAHCAMELCFTYHPADEPALIAETDAIVSNWLGNQDPRITLEVRELHNVKPFLTDPDLPSIHALGRALDRGPVRPLGFPTGSDGRLISRVLNCPTVIFGPGDAARIHRPNEAVEIAEVVAHAAAIENFVSSDQNAT